ncbi:hypothetical protein LAZ67_20000006 [Cordylochernes scorpioides]|uniref:Uncharacterized protein n=1 Tax=Cordylochernes scorpioides TaxID=51811 RepID=A0ABY6LMM1_9ARAC|nr:hypothetical protein LAZ67_20000006 [Cordylochernes scorpioides]
MQVPVQRFQLWTHKPFSGLQYNTHIDYTADSSVDIGQMSRVCQFCSALRFRDEPFGLCCKQGRVSLLAIESPPEPIFSLLSGLHPLSKSFLLHIRRYNSIFQMTSFGARQVVTSSFLEDLIQFNRCSELASWESHLGAFRECFDSSSNNGEDCRVKAGEWPQVGCPVGHSATLDFLSFSKLAKPLGGFTTDEPSPPNIFFHRIMALQKIDIDPEQQLYTSKIVDIAVIEMYRDICGSSLDTTTKRLKHSKCRYTIDRCSMLIM